jgi:integrase
MRLGELRGLRWSDVDLDAGQIHVRQRASQWMEIGPPKPKAGKHDIPLAPIVVNTLRQWRVACPNDSNLDLVFPNTVGHIDSVQGIHSRFWVPLQIKCGLTTDTGKPRYNFHMLRHAAASLFIKYLGWSPKQLQVVMGHASITQTFDRYGHLFESAESDRADMEKIEKAVRAS